MTLILVYAALYLIVLPGTLFGIHLLHKKVRIQKKSEKMKKKGVRNPDLPKPLWPKISRHLKTAINDKRPLTIAKKNLGVQNRFILWGLFGIGLALTIYAGTSGKFTMLLYGVVLFYASVCFGLMTAKKIIRARDKILSKMFEIASSKLNQSSDYKDNPGAIIRILEWRDPVTPSKVQFEIPTSFNSEGEEAFLKHFNQYFGTETAWVPDGDLEKGKTGWNYDEGNVILKEVPPLPQKAPRSEHYVLGEGVAWSFFPIGLAVENGLELKNPETGQVENVIGFDVAGEQGKVAQEAGIKMASKITTSPQVFIGGSTGGGKSLSVDTLVAVVTKGKAAIQK